MIIRPFLKISYNMISCFAIFAMMHVYGAMTVVIFIHSKEFGDDEGVEGDDGGDGI